VRAYTGAEGRECVQVGQLRDGVFGRVQSGTFRALPASMPGNCGHPNARGALVAVSREAAVDLTLVFGLAVDRSPVRIRFGDREQVVRPVGLGAFVAVFAGDDRRVPIVVRSKVGGSVDVHRFH
jgi:hypothetical protein